MNVGWNPDIFSYFLNSTSTTQSKPATTSEKITTSLNSIIKGTDSLEISQAAINASLAMEKYMSSENNSSQTYNSELSITDKLDAMVSSGTITQDQSDAVKNALAASSQGTPPPPPPQNGSFEKALTDALDSLVSSGTITKDQGTAIASALNSASSEKSTSPTNLFDVILDSLVSAGTITQDQESAIMDALFTLVQGTPPPPPPQNGGFEKVLAEALDSLVSSGTITEDQETAIADILMSSSFENSTSQTNPFEDILDSLVSAGTITQDQETAVGSAFKSAIDAYEMQLYGLQNKSAYNL